MTVAELLTHLTTFPADADVVLFTVSDTFERWHELKRVECGPTFYTETRAPAGPVVFLWGAGDVRDVGGGT